MVGVQVGDVDGLQVQEDVVSTGISELSVELEQCALTTIQKNEVV
jgi:hypothetical protein